METLLKLATTKTTLTLHKYSTFTKYFHVMVCSELLWQPVSDNYHKALYLKQFEKNEKKNHLKMMKRSYVVQKLIQIELIIIKENKILSFSSNHLDMHLDFIQAHFMHFYSLILYGCYAFRMSFHNAKHSETNEKISCN